MKKKIIRNFLIILTLLIGFYLIFIPFCIIYHENGQVISLLSNIHMLALLSVTIALLIILLNVIISKSTKLVRIERTLFLFLVGGNLVFLLSLLFLYINTSTLILDFSMTFAIIGILLVIFNGFFIAILATLKNKNI